MLYIFANMYDRALEAARFLCLPSDAWSYVHRPEDLAGLPKPNVLMAGDCSLHRDHRQIMAAMVACRANVRQLEIREL